MNALSSNTTGTNNTANGYDALFSNTTGSSNIAIGMRALWFNTTGYNNTVTGVNAMRDNTTGYGNTANGVDALYFNTTGYLNTASGVDALRSNTTGYQNTATGNGALYYNTTGLHNTASGANALLSNTTGYGNTASGLQALYSNTTGFSNTASGVNALYSNTTGYSNTASSHSALFSNTTGFGNSALGANAGDTNTTGTYNTFLGTDADATTAALTYATALGAGSTVATSNTIALGRNSTADQVVIGTASRNDTVANTKLYVNGISSFNGDLRGTTATFTGAVTVDSLGAQRLNVGTSAGGVVYQNLIIGNNAMTGAQSGAGSNTALGVTALASNTSGAYNTAVGTNALSSNTTGTYNTVTGLNTLLYNTTGNHNSATGPHALFSNTTGGANAALGSYAGSTNTTGSNNTFLGYAADATSGALTYATALGSESRVATSNTIALGRNSLTDQVVIGSDSRNDTYANTKLYVNGNVQVTNAINFNNTNGDKLNLWTGYGFGINTDNLTAYIPNSTGSRFSVRNGGSFNGTEVFSVTNTGNATVTGSFAANSLAAQRLDVTTSAGGVTYPNLILGQGAMTGAQSGSGANTAVGISALANNTSGNNNTAVGISSLITNTTGSNNSAYGVNALFSNTTGYGNTASGSNALASNTTGYQNTASGLEALYSNTTGVNNTADGHKALRSNTTGYSNTASGVHALYSNTTGAANTALGQFAGDTNTSGSNNTFLGNDTDATSAALSYATAIGSASTVATNNTIALGRNSTADQVVIGTATRNDTIANTKLYVNGPTNLNGNVRVGGTLTFNDVGGEKLNLYTGYGFGIADNNLYAYLPGSGTRFSVRSSGGAGTEVFTVNGDGNATVTGSLTANSLSAQRLNVGTSAGGVTYQNLIIGNGAMAGAQSGPGANTAVGINALNLNSTGFANTATGWISLQVNTTGYGNTATGADTLRANTTGYYNTANGYFSLADNTTGYNNTATGVNSLRYNTTGTDNTATGTNALWANTTGYQNTATGAGALYSNTTGNQNAALGNGALRSNTTGVGNTANSTQALFNNTTGNNNTGNALNVLYNNTTGSANTGSGSYALFNNTTGYGNTALGASAGGTNTTGSYNTFLGIEANPTSAALSYATAIGASSTVATSNTIALGRNSTADQVVIGTDTRNDTFANTKLYVNGNVHVSDTVNFNPTVGNKLNLWTNSIVSYGFGINDYNLTAYIPNGGTKFSVRNGGNYNGTEVFSVTDAGNAAVTGSLTANSLSAQRLNLGTSAGVTYENLIIGNGAMTGAQSGNGANTAVGISALASNTSGTNNTAVGFNSLISNTSGTHNIAIGTHSLFSNTTGNYNTATGVSTLRSNTTGYYNTATGLQALYSNTTGHSNTASGVSALYDNTTGVQNTATGLDALRYNTSGYNNTASGLRALNSNTTGNNNTASGVHALYSNTTGGSNVALGLFAGDSNTTGSWNTFLGDAADATSGALNYATAIGGGSTVATSNTIALGRNSTTDQVVIGTDSRNDTYGNTKLYVNGNVYVTDAVNFSNAIGNKLNLWTASGVSYGLGLNHGNLNAYIPNGARFSVRNGGNYNGTEVFSVTDTGNVNVTGSLTAQRLNLGAPAGVTYENLIIGNGAMTGAQSGTGANTAVGNNAMYSNSSGAYNTALGISAMFNNTTGTSNTAIGTNALISNTSGYSNTVTGTNALYANTTGAQNTATGTSALHNNTTGVNNTANGYAALISNTTGSHNTASGTHALYSTSTGISNAALGLFAGDSNTSGSNNTFLGADADATSGGLNFATAIGSESRVATSNTIALGRNSTTDQVVIGTASRNDTYGNTKLYVNGNVHVTDTVNFNPTAGNKLNLWAASGTAYGFGINNNNLTAYIPNTGGATRFSIRNGGNYNGTEVFSITDNGNMSLAGAMVSDLNVAQGYAVRFSHANASDINDGKIGAGLFSEGLNIVGVQTSPGAGRKVTVYGDVNVGGAVNATVATLNGGGGGSPQLYLSSGNRNLSFVSNAGVGAYNGLTQNGDNLMYFSNGGFNTGTLVIGPHATTSVGMRMTSGGTTFVGGLVTDSFTTATATISSLNVLEYRPVSSQGAYLQWNRDNSSGITYLMNQRGLGPGGISFGEVTTSNAYTQNMFLDSWGNLSVGASVSATRLNIGTNAGGVAFANLMVGLNAMPNAQSGNGGNAAIGVYALANNTTGAFNHGFGVQSMISNSSGSNNNAYGVNSLYSNTSGSYNTAMGRDAGFTNTTGSANTFLGSNANSTSGNLFFATAIGADSSVATDNTIALGRNSLTDQVVIGTASRNDSYIANTKLFVNGNTVVNGEIYTQGNLVINNTAGGQKIFFGQYGENSDAIYIGRVNTATDTSILQMVLGDNPGAATDYFQIATVDGSVRHSFESTGNVGHSGGVWATSFNVSSDRRLKTNIAQQNTSNVLDRLEQLRSYSYNYIANPDLGTRIGVIAQELQPLFPEAVATNANGMMSVDYNALGAMAAVGVGQLSTQFKALNNTVNEQGQKLTVLDEKVGKHNTRIEALEGWKTEAVTRMDTMQTAIDLNIQKIAENAVAIQSNTKAIERLDDALFTLDGTVKGNTESINKINARWARNFSASDDGAVLTVNAAELKVSNFTAQQMRANAVYTQRLEAEMAKIADLEVNNLRANSAVANTVQAEQVNTGSVQVYAGVGLPALLFAAKADGHYTVSTSALDGSYATATVIVNAGQAKVVKVASEGIDLVAEGNMVKAIAAGKSIKASWIKMG